VPHLEQDRHMAPDIAKAIALVRSGRLTRAIGEAALPGIA
jgi:histidine ammonia-lyase